MSAQIPETQDAPFDRPPHRGAGAMEDGRATEAAQLHRLELASFVEGTTLLLLLGIAVPMKHLGGWTWGVQIMGPVHGLAFLAYIWLAVQTVSGANWRRSEVARLIVFAVLPLGGFFNVAFLSRKIAALRADTKR